MRLIVVNILVLLLLTGCSSPDQKHREVTSWALPDKPREVVQLLSGSYGDHKFHLQVRLSMSTEQMRMVGVDTVGRRAFDIKWDDQGLASSRASWVSEELQTLDILKVVVITFWPTDTELHRQFLDESESNLQITYQSDRQNAWNETVQIADPENGYQMTIISKEIDE